MKRLVLAVAILVMSGCASLDVFTIEGTGSAKKEVKFGAPFHDSKPYLLVTRTGAKDGGVESKIVYVADQSVTYYARLNPGIGLNQFTLTLADGRLVSLNQQADTKLPELLANLAAPIKGLGEAAVSFANAGMTEQETKSLQASLAADGGGAKALFDTQGQVGIFGVAPSGACSITPPDRVPDHNQQISDVQAKRLLLAMLNLLCAYDTASPLARSTISEAAGSLVAIYKRDFPDSSTAVTLTFSGKHPTAQALRAIAASLKKFDISSGDKPTDAEQNIESLVKKAAEELGKIADEIDPSDPPTPQPTFQLYEIILTGGAIQLREVEILPKPKPPKPPPAP